MSDVIEIGLLTDRWKEKLLFDSCSHDKGFTLISVTPVYIKSMKNHKSSNSLCLIILSADWPHKVQVPEHWVKTPLRHLCKVILQPRLKYCDNAFLGASVTLIMKTLQSIAFHSQMHVSPFLFTAQAEYLGFFKVKIKAFHSLDLWGKQGNLK